MSRSKSGSISGDLDSTTGLPIPPPLKLVFIGDSTVGKTTFLYSYRKGEIHDNDTDHTSVLESFTKPVIVNGIEYICLLWDTIGSSDFETLRPLSYPKTDCFVICFAINDSSSFKNLQSKWIPEIKTHCPDVPFIFVGTKTDLRDSNQASEQVLNEDIKSLQNDTEAGDYVECSSKDLESVENICKSAVQVILDYQEKLKAIKEATSSQSSCTIS